MPSSFASESIPERFRIHVKSSLPQMHNNGSVLSRHRFRYLRMRACRCGKMSTHPVMKAAMTADAIGRLNARPPSFTGLSRKSPTVAPSGRLRMNAAQNNVTRDTFVQ